MSRSTVEITTEWQLIHEGVATFTVKEKGAGVLFIGDAPDDDTADRAVDEAGRQWLQNESKPTYARASRGGWEIIVDTLG